MLQANLICGIYYPTVENLLLRSLDVLFLSCISLYDCCIFCGIYSRCLKKGHRFIHGGQIGLSFIRYFIKVVESKNRSKCRMLLNFIWWIMLVVYFYPTDLLFLQH